MCHRAEEEFSNSIYAKMRVKFVNLLSNRNEWNMCIIIISDHVPPSFVLEMNGSGISKWKWRGKIKNFQSTMTNREKCVMPNSNSYCWIFFFFVFGWRGSKKCAHSLLLFVFFLGWPGWFGWCKFLIKVIQIKLN